MNKGWVANAEIFRPNDSITRAEFVKIFNKAFGLTASSGKVFSDTSTHWAKNSVEGVIEKGYMGAGGSTFQPKAKITRAETVVTLGRVISNTLITPGEPWPEVIVGDESQNNVSSSQYFAKAGDWIYYRNEKDNRKLYKMKIDGTNKIKLSEDSVGDIYIVGDWVVYAKFGVTGYVAIKKDGSLKYQL